MRTIKPIFVAASLTAVGILSGCSSNGSGATYKVGILEQVRVGVLDQEVAAFKQEFLKEMGLPASKVSWVEKNANGDAAQCSSISHDLAGDGLSAVAVAGTPCIIAMSQASHGMPVIALGMGDPVGAGVAKTLEQPGGDVTGSYQVSAASALVQGLAGSTPAPKRLGVIYDQSNDATVAWVDGLAKDATGAGMTLVKKGVSALDDIGPSARSVAGEVDAIVIPPDGLLSQALPVVASAALQSNTVVYTSGLPASLTLDGVVADVGPSYAQLGQLAARTAVSVLKDHQKTAETAFRGGQTQLWSVNEATIKSRGITLPSSVKTVVPSATN